MSLQELKLFSENSTSIYSTDTNQVDETESGNKSNLHNSKIGNLLAGLEEIGVNTGSCDTKKKSGIIRFFKRVLNIVKGLFTNKTADATANAAKSTAETVATQALVEGTTAKTIADVSALMETLDTNLEEISTALETLNATIENAEEIKQRIEAEKAIIAQNEAIANDESGQYTEEQKEQALATIKASVTNIQGLIANINELNEQATALQEIVTALSENNKAVAEQATTTLEDGNTAIEASKQDAADQVANAGETVTKGTAQNVEGGVQAGVSSSASAAVVPTWGLSSPIAVKTGTASADSFGAGGINIATGLQNIAQATSTVRQALTTVQSFAEFTNLVGSSNGNFDNYFNSAICAFGSMEQLFTGSSDIASEAYSIYGNIKALGSIQLG